MGMLDGKIAIITGATSGIGERSAELFVEEGATVVLAGRRADLGQAIAARLGQNASFVQADVGQEADRKALHAWNQGEYGDAATLWRSCYNLMRQYANYGAGETVKRMRLERAEKFLENAHKAEERAKQSAPVAVTAVTAVAERAGSGDYAGVIEGLITRVNVRWADIGGLDETKATIQANYALALAQPPAGVQIRPQRTLLLYGPPGTGKTMLAAAAAAIGALA